MAPEETNFHRLIWTSQYVHIQDLNRSYGLAYLSVQQSKTVRSDGLSSYDFILRIGAGMERTLCQVIVHPEERVDFVRFVQDVIEAKLSNR